MSNAQAIIAEVKTTLSEYADAHLLDDHSMYRDLVMGLKKFGNDITQLHETVIEVVDGYADLPMNFYSLYLAATCEPMGFKKAEGCTIEVHDLQDSNFYRERTVQNKRWNECDPCCETNSENVIRENLYYQQEKVAEFYYENPQILSLGKTFNRNNYHSECRNKLVKDNPNQIVIQDFKLQANFNSGTIYMMYYGLPQDEDGQIEIPDTSNGELEEYLEYRVLRKTAERLIARGKAQPGLREMYKVYRSEENILKRAASNEVKMSRINIKRLNSRLKRLNRLESLQFESPFTRMYT